MTKSYKLVTLAALLKLDALHAGASFAEVAAVSLGFTRRDPRFRADTEQTREVSHFDSVTSERWQAFWTKNPLTHLTDEPHSLFQLSGQRLEPRFQVPAEHVTAFSALVSEIVGWRLQVYLRNRDTSAATVPRRALDGCGARQRIGSGRVRYRLLRLRKVTPDKTMCLVLDGSEALSIHPLDAAMGDPIA